jgi:hypothetical protein
MDETFESMNQNKPFLIWDIFLRYFVIVTRKLTKTIGNLPMVSTDKTSLLIPWLWPYIFLEFLQWLSHFTYEVLSMLVLHQKLEIVF